MDTFVVIYEFSPFRYFGWPLLLIGAFAAAFAVYAYRERSWGLMLVPLGILAFVGFGVWYQLGLHLETIAYLRSGRVSAVEGEIVDARVTGNSGNQTFSVKGVAFGDHPFMLPGFHANANWGPTVRNGLYARVQYFDLPTGGISPTSRIITKLELRRPMR